MSALLQDYGDLALLPYAIKHRMWTLTFVGQKQVCFVLCKCSNYLELYGCDKHLASLVRDLDSLKDVRSVVSRLQ